MDKVVKYLKEKSKLPTQFYKDMRTKIINLSPETLLKYEIVHKVMKLHTREMTSKNIIKYLHIDEMTNNYTSFSRDTRVKGRTPKTPLFPAKRVKVRTPKQKQKPKST